MHLATRRSSFVSLIVCFFFASISSALEITQLDVPRLVSPREDANLSCLFLLSPQERLHSVKWYRTSEDNADKDSGGGGSSMEEFYSYQPDRRTKQYQLKGVKVDVPMSGMNHVLLRGVTPDATGQYRCEVTSRKTLGLDARVRQAWMEVTVPMSNAAGSRVRGNHFLNCIFLLLWSFVMTVKN